MSLRDSFPLTRTSRWAPGGDLRRAALVVFLGGAWIIGLAIATWSLWFYLVQQPGSLGMDARAYFLAGEQDDPYHLAPADPFAVLYSPVFVQVMRLLSFVPWPVFLLLWLGGNVVAYWWLSSPLSWRWRVPVLALCVPSVLIGNVYGAMCVCFVVAVLGRPASASGLAVLAFTKITPAGVAGLWFLFRRDWQRTGVALGTIVLLTTASVLLDAQLWAEWIDFLAAHSQRDGWLPVRLVAALGLVVWVARRGPLWVLGVAFYLAAPMASLVAQELVPLMTIPRLVAGRTRRESAAE